MNITTPRKLVSRTNPRKTVKLHPKQTKKVVEVFGERVVTAVDKKDVQRLAKVFGGQGAELLDRIDREFDIAINTYARYMARPDTPTGAREHERFQKHETKLRSAVNELRTLIAAA